jgi:hypothetical protein
MKEEDSIVTWQWHYDEIMSAQGLTSTDGRTIFAANINKHYNIHP